MKTEELEDFLEEIQEHTTELKEASIELMDYFSDSQLVDICDRLSDDSLSALRAVNVRFAQICEHRPIKERWERALPSARAYREAEKYIAENPFAFDLDLSYMGLKQIPPEIGQMIRLKELKLNNNRLTTLPREIEHLTGLGVLYLQNNKLTTLPSALLRLPRLSLIMVGGNLFTWEDLPEEFQHLPLNFDPIPFPTFYE